MRSAVMVTHYYPNRENRFTTLWRGPREHVPLCTVAQNRTISALSTTEKAFPAPLGFGG